MSSNYKYIIPIILIIVGIVLLSLGNYQDNYTDDPEKSPYYIKPSDFTVGNPTYPEVYKSSNLCDDTTLKPIIPVSVDYGFKMPESCPCTKYLEPP
jgi:hypothetical protein